jgi:hypothetical protein
MKKIEAQVFECPIIREGHSENIQRFIIDVASVPEQASPIKHCLGMSRNSPISGHITITA